MSDERAAALLALHLGIAACGGAALAEEARELEFLEYLGSFEEGDADWLMFEEPAETDDERHDPAAEAEESTETDDES